MLFWVNFLIYTLLVVFVVDCVLMCLVILMQRSKQEGLGAAFGGGFTESVWGAQTSQVLVKATVVLAAVFFLTSIGLARLYTVRTGLTQNGSAVQHELMKSAVPAGTNTAPLTPSTNAMDAPKIESVPTAAATNSAPAEPAKPAAK